MKSVFEYGTKQSNRDDWLIQVPNAATLFAANNYSTFHSGKWHLGGMRNDDYDMRVLQDKGEGVAGSRRCHHPGPQQQGFQHYVSVLDGPGAPRQNYLQVNNRLYSEGCNFLLADDVPITKQMFNISGYLSYCEARHAMRGIKESLDQGKPFYIHLWFHAPHGPWEDIPGYPSVFTNSQYPKNKNEAVRCDAIEGNRKRSRYCILKSGKIVDRGGARFGKYATMVSDMDKQIGMVLNYLTELGIEKDTFVFFTSDNGYEDDAGSAGGLRANKRHIYEGGIRVPAIAQWVGTFPAGGVMNSMSVNTDLLPTFADAAGLHIPREKYHLDGISILPELLHAINPMTASAEEILKADTPKSKSSHLPSSSSNPVTEAPYGIYQIADLNNKLLQLNSVQKHKRDFKKRFSMLQERLILYFNEYEGPRRTVGIAYDYKFILDESEIPIEIYDLREDITESHNLLLSMKWLQAESAGKGPKEKMVWTDFKANVLNTSSIPLLLGGWQQSPVSLATSVEDSSSSAAPAKKDAVIHHLRDLPLKITRSMIGGAKHSALRKDRFLVFHLLYRLYPLMYHFAMSGANGYTSYMKEHPETRYAPSPLSDQRPMASNVLRLFTQQKAEQIRKALVEQSSCPVTHRPYTCSCAISTQAVVEPLPFYPDQQLAKSLYHLSMNPLPFLNSSVFLFDL